MVTIVTSATLAGAAFLLVAWFIGAREGRRSRAQNDRAANAVPKTRQPTPDEELARFEERQRGRRAEIRAAVTRQRAG